MVADDGNEVQALIGRQAVDWLLGQKAGGQFFDGAMMGVAEVFGRERNISALVPLRAEAVAAGFFLEVEGSVGDDSDWDHLVKAHEILLLQERGVRGRPSKGRDRFERFHLVLTARPLEPVALAEAQSLWFER